MNNDYTNLCQNWKVTTEGDEEGRTIVDLGTHFGFVDEIASRLADKRFYSLRFSVAKPLPVSPERLATEVSVSFDIDSETWGMDLAQLGAHMADLFKSRPVEIAPSTYYASFKIKFPVTPEQQRAHRKQALLERMSEEDRALFE